MYQLKDDFPNDVTFRILINQKISENRPKSMESQLSAQSSCQNKGFGNSKRKLLKNRKATFPVPCYFS